MELWQIAKKIVEMKNGKVTAPSFTVPIEILINASKVLKRNKIKKAIISDSLSAFAPSLGLEPRTL
jgi:hypothetical protein